MTVLYIMLIFHMLLNVAYGALAGFAVWRAYIRPPDKTPAEDEEQLRQAQEEGRRMSEGLASILGYSVGAGERE